MSKKTTKAKLAGLYLMIEDLISQQNPPQELTYDRINEYGFPIIKSNTGDMWSFVPLPKSKCTWKYLKQLKLIRIHLK